MSTDAGNPQRADTLIGRDRIRGASRMIPQGTEASAVTQEQIDLVVADTLALISAYKKELNQKVVAQSIGYSPATVSEFLKGTYAGNRGQLAIDLELWLVEEEQRRNRPRTTQFTWTNVALQIKAVANYALDFKKISLVYGPDTSGIGKTTSLQAIAQEIGPRRASLATIDKVDANPTGLLRKLCNAVGIQDSGSNRQRFTRIVEKLTGRAHLLLIDQIHNLRNAKDDKPFYILTDLYDATNTAQLWCGTADLVTYLEGQQAKHADESLAQVRRRIFPRIDLMEGLRESGGGGEPLVTIEQIREMFSHNQLKLAQPAARFLCTIANRPDSGSVGLCVQVVEYATMLADMRRLTSIDVPLLLESLRRALTTERAEHLLHDIKAEPLRQARSA